MDTGKYSNFRPAGREHIPVYPRGFIAIRVVQLVMALVILGLCAYSLSFASFSGNGLSLFTAVATLIITVYSIVVEFGPANGYNYWAVLSLDIFAVVFWVASFALLASQVAPIMDGYTVCDYYECDTYALTGESLTVAACLCAAAGLGGVETILFLVSLAYHSVVMHRHRSAGLHCTPTSHGRDAGSSIPMGGPVAVADKAQPTQTAYPAVSQPQYADPGAHQTAMATPSPPPAQQMYQPPTSPSMTVESGQHYPQIQQYQIPVQPQYAGANYGGAGMGQVPPPHPGSYEAQG